MVKTNAMRILDSNNIKYKEYVLDIKEALDGVTCAKMLNVNIDSTFKTLVTVGKSGNYYVFVIPVDKKLDLKKAACSVNEKNIEMLPMKNLLAITGYVHGGCSPIGMKKVLNTVIDKSALLFNKIIFSGGKIGYFIEIDVKDIVKVLNVKYDDLVG